MRSPREALADLHTLRKRDARLRQETELVFKVVKIFADHETGDGTVQKILDAVRQGFMNPACVLIERTRTGLETCYSAIGPVPDHWETAEFTTPDFLRKPGRVFDVRKLPGWQDVTIDHGTDLNTSSCLMAPIQYPGRWLGLYLFRSSTQFGISDFRVFSRLLPLIQEGLKREANAQERARLEVEVRHLQKMEALGTLAGGIAHELNTPMQYVTNNILFLSDAFQEINRVLSLGQISRGTTAPDHLDDFDDLITDIPSALKQTQDGLEQMTKIIKAVQEFSHPGTPSPVPHDLNMLVETALTVSHNQWKHCALVETDLCGTLPAISCFGDGIRQVILNLIVNAAHAIEDLQQKGTGQKKGNKSHDLGRIHIRTENAGDSVILEISDTGTGMPPDVRERIFDPFFTTKDPGRGTGQGLSICHSIIIQKHGGRINIDSTEGHGTTIRIQIPVCSPQETETIQAKAL